MSLFSNTDGGSPESPKLNSMTSVHEEPLMRKVFQALRPPVHSGCK